MQPNTVVNWELGIENVHLSRRWPLVHLNGENIEIYGKKLRTQWVVFQKT